MNWIMCVGCYSMPMMALVLPEPDASSKTTVPLTRSLPNQQGLELKAFQVQAEIAQMTQSLPESPYIEVLRAEFTALHQQLNGITRHDQVNTIVSVGLLNIANGLDLPPHTDRLIKLLPKVQIPQPQKQASPVSLEQQSWGWL